MAADDRAGDLVARTLRLLESLESLDWCAELCRHQQPAVLGQACSTPTARGRPTGHEATLSAAKACTKQAATFQRDRFLLVVVVVFATAKSSFFFFSNQSTRQIKIKTKCFHKGRLI